MLKTNEPIVEFAQDERGLLITLPPGDGGKGQMILIPRSGVSNASRVALQAFVQLLSEVHDFSEIAPGDAVISAEDRTLNYGFGLSTPIRRGQRIDNLAWIEQLLREGCRLLRPNPDADGDTQTELLRQALLDESYLGLARNIVIAKRAAAGSA